jgi:DAK2 domain fusion protein YloV
LPSNIDGVILKEAVINGSNNLLNNRKKVDDMNVFPVPDGDTGTNMSMTISAAAREVLSQNDSSVSKVADLIALASLRGARGNSGVILSQLFRGFAKGLGGKDSVDIPELAAAFKSAADTAYKAIMKPTEGTILTVARVAAEYAVEIAEEESDMIAFCEKVLEKAKEALDATPQMLPVLKQAGVVDAGGMGLVVILEGAIASLKGEKIEAAKTQAEDSQVKKAASVDTANIKFTYCTEFIINKHSLNYSVAPFKAAIESVGDSMLVIEDEDIVKVHIHTNRPGFVLEQAVKIGDLSDIKIDNMKIQHNETIAAEHDVGPAKKYGFIAVASGEGLEQIFKDIGVDYVVRGGQSMNPSTEDILDAVERVNAQSIFVLPNNKNIILAAEQAAKLSDKNLIVIPTKTIPQGISAVLAFDETQEPDVNVNEMKNAISYIKTGQVTFAARDSEMDGLKIKAKDIMGITENKITVLGKNSEKVALEVVKNLIDDDSAVVTLFYGSDVKEKEAESVAKELKKIYKNCDILMHYGGQPLYYYIISVE